MDLQTTKQINIDVAKYKYISLNAKQYDRNLRYILITCYCNDELLPINKNTHFASVRYGKPDNRGVFNTCEITSDGKILIELTEQMLAVVGTCYADVVIHENANLTVDIVENADGTIVLKDMGNSGILSTMTFAVYVHEAAFDNQEIESSYEYNALNDLLTESRRSYENVLTTSNKYMKTTEGYMETTEGYMTTTDGYMKTTQGYMDDTQSYMKTTESYMTTAEEYKNTTEGYMTTTEEYKNTTSDYKNTTEGYMTTTEEYKNTTEEYMNTTEDYMTTADDYMGNAKNYMDTAESHMNTAKDYMDNAKASEEAAKASEEAVAKNAETVKNIADGLVGGFIPNGTVAFEDLASVEKITGYTYNISNDFVTDETFREGAGMSYTAGTNVYWTNSDEWDCLGGAVYITATVDEVKEYLGILDDGEIIV